MKINRISRLSALMPGANLDALVLNAGPSLVYMTGLHFHLSERPVAAIFLPDRSPVIVLPALELPKMEPLHGVMQAFPYEEDPSGWDKVFREALGGLNLDGKRIGMEPRQMRMLEFRLVQAGASGAEYLDGSQLISKLRITKDKEELAAMRKAVTVAQEALEVILPSIRIGMTEKELAAELVIQLLRHGSQSDMPFAPIVSAGPNGANPHAVPSERKLQTGDLLVVDWGATVDGYVSDLTRTFTVGEPSAESTKISEVVLEANAAGREAGSPGVPCGDVDKAARQVIEKAGYGHFFTHRTGHGIGMESHEEPYIRSDNMQLLEPGMAFTVEPGIYLPGQNGVRIEDNLVVTATGIECLSDMDREIRQIG
jgi:Xaa-Pro dipeptidase